MRQRIFRLVLAGFTISLCACATPASVDMTKEKTEQLQRQQDSQKQQLDKINEEKQQAEKRKMQEQIDRLKTQ